MVVRGLDERVDTHTAERLRTITSALSALQVESYASRIYVREIVESVNNGLFLSAIVLSTILLEIWVRDLLVIHMCIQERQATKKDLQYRLIQIDREVEGARRGKSFKEICCDLIKMKVIQKDEHEKIQNIYDKFRTPLLHGITGRIVDPRHLNEREHPDTWTDTFLAITLGAVHRRANSLEDVVYGSVTSVLADIVNFMGAHQIPKIDDL